MKLEELSVLLAKYSLPYATFSLTVPAIKLWHELFRNDSILDLEFAFRLLVKQPGRLYFPTPGEVTEAIRQLHTQHQSTTGQAWIEVMQYAQCGANSDVVIKALESKGDTASAHAINVIGWNSIKSADIKKELPWMRKEFEKLREQFNERDQEVKHVQIERNQARLECSKIFQKLIKGGENGNV